MLPIRSPELTPPLDATSLSVPIEDTRSARAAGWQVLAVLQFIAAGSLVFALAARTFFPQGFRAAFLQSTPVRAYVGPHGTICVGYRRPARPSRASQTQTRVAFGPSGPTARSPREERSPFLAANRASVGARAPPC